VRILKVRSGCGCTKAEASTDRVKPGATCTVEAVADPLPAGVRTVTLTLETDSPRAPEVDLKLRLTGNRPPPFVMSVAGTPTFTNGFDPKDERKVVVTTIEPPERSGEPRLETDLPFVGIEGPEVVTKPYGEQDYGPAIVYRTYTFRVSLRERPPIGTFTGLIAAIDPWNGGVSGRLTVAGAEVPAVRPIPTILQLVAGTSAKRFRVLSRDPAPSLVVDPGDGPVVVERDIGGRSDRSFGFTAQVPSGTPPGRYDLAIRPAPGAEAVGTVAVLVTAREANP